MIVKNDPRKGAEAPTPTDPTDPTSPERRAPAPPAPPPGMPQQTPSIPGTAPGERWVKPGDKPTNEPNGSK